jgi:hypothetical protein
MAFEVDLIWQSQQAENSKFIKSKIDEITCVNCFLATNCITNTRNFLIEFDDKVDFSNVGISRFKGVEIQIIQLDDKKVFVIALLENSLRNIFTLLIEDILKELSISKDQSLALKAVFNVISLWRRLFENSQPDGLTIEKQIGLYGELYFLLKCIESKGAEIHVLDAWLGPDGYNQDFIFNTSAVEIKTSAANHPAIGITNELQLYNDTNNDLYLYFLSIDIRKGKTNTLNTLIDFIKTTFQSQPDLIRNFNMKLQKYGYYEKDTELYNNRQFIVRSVRTYQIADGFPTLTPANIPDGIFNVSYKIEFSACVGFELNAEKLYSLI